MRLTFEAFRNEQHIGRQVTSFERRGDSLQVLTVAEFLVKLGPIPFYRYRHNATEHWTAGAFDSIAAVTNQNGRAARVSAVRSDGRVTISPASGGAFAAPVSALPFTHWNRVIAAAPLFNPQDGKLLRETAQGPTRATVRLASGVLVPAARIGFRGDAYIDDYYGADDVWIGLGGRLSDGSWLEYRRL